MKNFLPLLMLGVTLAACSEPAPPPSAQDLATEIEFTAKFGLPGEVPLRPEPVRTPLEQMSDSLFGTQPAAVPPLLAAQPPAVPLNKIEPIPRKPRLGVYQWQPSAWEWNGYEFAWKLGAWVQPPAGMIWQSGAWEKDSKGAWIWRTGGWVAG